MTESRSNLERISELELKLRGIGDRVEREGGAAVGAERERLERNRRLNARELEEVRAELDRLRGS